MTLKLEAPIEALNDLQGKEPEVTSGNAVFGRAYNFRSREHDVICDANIDNELWKNYGGRGFIANYPVTEEVNHA